MPAGARADLVLSLHFDGLPSGVGRGVTAYSPPAIYAAAGADAVGIDAPGRCDRTRSRHAELNRHAGTQPERVHRCARALRRARDREDAGVRRNECPDARRQPRRERVEVERRQRVPHRDGEIFAATNALRQTAPVITCSIAKSSHTLPRCHSTFTR